MGIYRRLIAVGTTLTLLLAACSTASAPAAPPTPAATVPASTGSALPAPSGSPSAAASVQPAAASVQPAVASPSAAGAGAAAAGASTADRASALATEEVEHPAQPVPTARPAQTPPPIQPASASDWSQIVAAAKQEGSVTVIGPQGTPSQQGLSNGFEALYPGIQVDYEALPGDQIGAKVLAEEAANKNTTDVIITGTTTAIQVLEPADVLDPVQSWLVGPDDSDPSVWSGGKFDFADSANEYNLIFSSYVKTPFIYNSDDVNPDEFNSYWDLINPQWKGKVAFRDPLVPGSGLAVITFWYTTPGLGKDYITQFFQQLDPTISQDDQQMMDYVARGEYPIIFGVSDTLANEYETKGFPVKHMDGRMIEGQYVTAGNGSLVVPHNPAHPNATKLYLDWLLSQSGQTDWTQSQGFSSERTDVDTSSVLPLLVPQPGVTYEPNASEPYVLLRDEIVSFLKGLGIS